MIDKLMASSNRPVITLLSSFMLAIIHQYLFYGKEVGVSYPIFVILFYGWSGVDAGAYVSVIRQ